MKKYLWMSAAALLLLALLFPRREFPGWEAPEGLSPSQSRAVREDLIRAAEACRDAADREELEARLIYAGFATVDTDGNYPSYLANAEALREFAGAEEGNTAVLRASEDGGFSYLYFLKGRENLLISLQIRNENGEFRVTEQEVLPLYEAVLAEDVFYYRCYPAGDPHYIDYNTFRLAPVDRELYDLTASYILPVGYRMVNLFLTNWQEGDWAGLSFNDTFEYLYELQRGEAFPWQDYPADASGCRWIPAELFEDTILPYFSITREELRIVAWYDEAEAAYPWRAVHGDDLTSQENLYPQPEVTSCIHNPDGTLALTVQVASPEKMTNNLFTHEVTIRPTESGFQYVGNRITYVNQWGLPFSGERFSLDK